MSTTFGLDTAFRRDATAGVAVRRTGDVYDVLECVEIKPPKGGRLVPSETIRALLERARSHGARLLVCDQHYVETVREHAADLVLVEAPGGILGKLEVYTRCRSLIAEGRVRVPAREKRLLAQLKQVVSKPTPGGQITISSPRRPGAHGDLASAFTLALWGASERGGTPGEIIIPSGPGIGSRWDNSPGRGFG